MAEKNIRTTFCQAEPKPQLSWAEWLYFQCRERGRGVLWRRCNLARFSTTKGSLGISAAFPTPTHPENFISTLELCRHRKLVSHCLSQLVNSQQNATFTALALVKSIVELSRQLYYRLSSLQLVGSQPLLLMRKCLPQRKIYEKVVLEFK